MNKLSHAKFFWLFFLALNKMEFNTVVGMKHHHKKKMSSINEIMETYESQKFLNTQNIIIPIVRNKISILQLKREIFNIYEEITTLRNTYTSKDIRTKEELELVNKQIEDLSADISKNEERIKSLEQEILADQKSLKDNTQQDAEIKSIEDLIKELNEKEAEKEEKEEKEELQKIRTLTNEEKQKNIETLHQIEQERLIIELRQEFDNRTREWNQEQQKLIYLLKELENKLANEIKKTQDNKINELEYQKKQENFNIEENQKKSYIYLSEFCAENLDFLETCMIQRETLIVSLCIFNSDLFYATPINKQNIKNILKNFSKQSKISNNTMQHFSFIDLAEIAKKNEITKENIAKISQFCDAYTILENVSVNYGSSLTNNFNIIKSFFLEDKFFDPLLIKILRNNIFDDLKKDYETLKDFNKKEDKDTLQNTIEETTNEDLKKETKQILDDKNITDAAKVSQVKKIVNSYFDSLHVFIDDQNNKSKQELTEEEQKKLEKSNDHKFFNLLLNADKDNTNIYFFLESNKLFAEKIKSSNESEFMKKQIIQRLFSAKSTKEEFMSQQDLNKEKEELENLKKYFNLEKKNQTTDTNNSKDEDKKTNDEKQNTATPIENQNQKKSFIQEHSGKIMTTAGLLTAAGVVGALHLIPSSEKENTQLVAAAA
jgi:hypothetical protein